MRQSRRRQTKLQSRFLFITCSAGGPLALGESELDSLAEALNRFRRKGDVVLCGYCLLPDRWHAVVARDAEVSIADVLLRLKLVNFGAGQSKAQFCEVLRTRREIKETLAYMHAQKPPGWRWSSARWFVDGTGPVEVDDVPLSGGRRSAAQPKSR